MFGAGISLLDRSLEKMDAKNLLIIMSDQHSNKMLGCYGHPMVRTPNLDALAGRGTLFTDAYTCCPVCIPARAAFATGKYIHQIAFWDNADPYDGSVASWHHYLRDQGHRVVSIGKLHFRSAEDDNGFSEEIIPMHVIDKKGDLMGLVREDLPVRGAAWKMAGMAGAGESSYTHYDREIAARAQVWLHEEAPKYRDKPWVLFVSFVTPHYPLTAPPEYYYAYLNDPDLPWPKAYGEDERPDHPFVAEYRASFNFDTYFDDERKVRQAIAGYFGLCTFMDEQVGKVLDALADSGLAADTRVAYTSDHGDNLGARGLWGKSTLYEETANIPLILAGPVIPEDRVIRTPVSHVDFLPFILEALGEATDEFRDAGCPGHSLFELAAGGEPERTVLCEYHAMGSTTGAFMIRWGRYKYVHYVAFRPQLFDLESDPEELHDLAQDPAFAGVIADCEAKVRDICDPEEVDRRAKARQADQLEAAGGREAVIARGDLGFTPAPGSNPEFE
jgi:choline-sulfatase